MATAKYDANAVPVFQKPDTRRPNPNPLIPLGMIQALFEYFDNVKETLEEHAAHMRPLDRSRVNGVGIRRQGFIKRAFQLAVDNPEFLPHWLTVHKFEEGHARFVALRGLFDLNRQISEILWNLIMNSADMVYTDALEYYDSVRSAAKRRIDAAEVNNNLTEAQRHGVLGLVCKFRAFLCAPVFLCEMSSFNFKYGHIEF